MNMYDAQVFVQNLFPGKTIQFGFDDICVQFYEVDLIDASPDTPHFIQYDQLKAVIQDIPSPMYVPIDAHRIPITWGDLKPILQELINNN